MLTEGYLKDDVNFGNKLLFEIDFDQTILKHTITEINATVDQLKKRWLSINLCGLHTAA